MKNVRPTTAFAPHDQKRFITPATMALVVVMSLIILIGLFNTPRPDLVLILYGAGGIVVILSILQLSGWSAFFREKYSFLHFLVGGVGAGALTYILPPNMIEFFHIMVVLSTLTITITSGENYGLMAVAVALLASLPGNLGNFDNIANTLGYFEPFLIGIIVARSFTLIKDSAQQNIHRLETINKVSRQLMQSLDTEQMLALLSQTITETLRAESYFIGVLKEDQKTIRLQLMYDEGEFFNGTELSTEGTLSGWVIKNQKELFLPDLREDAKLDGVAIRIVGKEKTSLSWIGVPLISANINGIMAMASYQPNAFDLADLELLSHLAQHVTLALENTARHAQVEQQAQLDSLTGVYNHGYFLKLFAEQAKKASQENIPLSLIMLDIDFFKQYNDTYGHLVGDRILNSLCTAIKSHIKHGDAVGRWGGEEFIISLPNTTLEQATQVARRISQTMALLRVEDRLQRTVPVPTVSQGIAVFPSEADEIYGLIDLADKRLYTAKERGRNQIEIGVPHEQATPSR